MLFYSSDTFQRVSCSGFFVSGKLEFSLFAATLLREKILAAPLNSKVFLED